MSKALIVIDVQNDFCPGGALEVPGGDKIIDGINAAMAGFDAVILTQDWHPAGHSSFASSHDGKTPLDVIGLRNLRSGNCREGLSHRAVPI